MRHHQDRVHTYGTSDPETPTFPAEVSVSLTFAPASAFTIGGGDRTVPFGESFTAEPDMATGRTRLTCRQPTSALAWESGECDRPARFDGDTLSLSFSCTDAVEFEAGVERLVELLPPLLSVGFADPVYVSRVHGRIGTYAFERRYAYFGGYAEGSSIPHSQAKLDAAWRRLPFMDRARHPRVAAALAYLHRARRLRDAGATPWEFGGEILLNLSKMLEVLFGETRDNARTGLRVLGYDEEIERDFLPVMRLRPLLDVAHVRLASLTEHQLRVVHGYCDIALEAFRALGARVLEVVEAHPESFAGRSESTADDDRRLEALIRDLAAARPTSPGRPALFSSLVPVVRTLVVHEPGAVISQPVDGHPHPSA